MENNEIKDIEKNVDEVVEETITEEAINEEVIEEANEIIEAVEEEKDVKKVKAALEALKAKLANAGSAVKVKVAGAGSAIKGKGKIVVTTISGKMVNAKDAVKNSKFGKAVGNGTTKVVVYVKGHKKGVIAIASGAALVAALGIGGCAAHKHFSNKSAVETTVTPTPSVAPTATPSVAPTIAPTSTPVPTQAPVVEMNEVQKMVSARADELMKEFAEKGLTVKDTTDEELKSMIEAAYALVNIETLGEDINEIAGTPAERKALYTLAKNFMHKLALHNAKSLSKSAQYISVTSLSDIKSDKDIIAALEYIPTYKKALYAGELHDTCVDAYAELYLRFFKEQSNDNEVKFEDLTIGGKMLSEIALGEATNFVLGSSDYLSDKLARELDTLSKKVFTGSDFATINSIYASKENTLTK